MAKSLLPSVNIFLSSRHNTICFRSNAHVWTHRCRCLKVQIMQVTMSSIAGGYSLFLLPTLPQSFLLVYCFKKRQTEVEGSAWFTNWVRFMDEMWHQFAHQKESYMLIKCCGIYEVPWVVRTVAELWTTAPLITCRAACHAECHGLVQALHWNDTKNLFQELVAAAEHEPLPWFTKNKATLVVTKQVKVPCREHHMWVSLGWYLPWVIVWKHI